MRQQCLEITRLTKSGDTIKTFRCRSGRVSVFRSNNEELHQLYINALCGGQTDERFSILLNGELYIPGEHILIGFGGEKIPFAVNQTVSQLLQSCGMELKEIEPVLLKLGLGGSSGSLISDLQPDQLDRLVLLYATSQTERIVVMKDPFLLIDEKWRDAYAARIVDYVWEKHAIVVIANLDWRPEEWIDNDLIARIQIDHTVRRATIGMGGENMLTDMAKKIRQSFVKEEKQQTDVQPIRVASTKIIIDEAPKEPPMQTTQKDHPPLFGSIGLLVGALSVALITSVGYILLPNAYDEQKSVTIVKDNVITKQYREGQNTDYLAESPTAHHQVVDHAIPAQREEEQFQQAEYTYVLDSYPEDIQQSVKKAFTGEIDLTSVKGLENKAPAQRPYTPPRNGSSYSSSSSYRSNNNQRTASPDTSKIFEKLLELRARGRR